MRKNQPCKRGERYRERGWGEGEEEEAQKGNINLISTLFLLPFVHLGVRFLVAPASFCLASHVNHSCIPLKERG